MRLILAILSRLETGLSTLWRRKRGKLRPLRFVGFCSGVAGCGGADRGRLVSAAACPRGSWHRLSGKHGASCCLWQAVCADIGLGLQVPAGSTYLEGSGYRPQRRSHGLLRCLSQAEGGACTSWGMPDNGMLQTQRSLSPLSTKPKHHRPCNPLTQPVDPFTSHSGGNYCVLSTVPALGMQ